jgi:hypothetical protein
VSWQNLCCVAIGAVVAVVGGLANVPGLLALGGMIVTGALGASVPGRNGAAPAARGPVQRVARSRRRNTPASLPLLDPTMRNRIP